MIADAHGGNALPREILEASSPEMTPLIARHDWARTPVGDPDTWPAALNTVLELALGNRFPVVFWWGPEYVQFYNDAYRIILGSKHPESLGQSPEECWAEIWHIIGPQIESVFAGGPATWNEDLMLEMNRFGFVEETFFTYSYSALPDPGAPRGIGGVLATVQETTQKVIAERRIRLLHDLAVRGTEAKTVEEECRLAVQTLDRNPETVPFSLIYLLEPGDGKARLAAGSGVVPDAAHEWRLDPGYIDGVRQLDRTDALVAVLPPDVWTQPDQTAVIAPIPSSVPNEVFGYLVAGVNAKRPFDEGYRDFYSLVAAQIGTAVSRARAFEDEKRRSEALAEIDRAKNVFFSNVSHEFRTPLTLMLGPLADLAKETDDRSRPLVEAAHRNALRLLKLVNTLLEFSRLEAGRTDATYARTDLGALTEELCSVFRSAIEHAGLTLTLNVDLREPVYVDRAMWEKIVLNLLSNALKFTMEGGIEVTLRRVGSSAELLVRDTGIGIASDELPRVFERFRRVRAARSRSYEGSGIGLALVADLVELHGGSIDVESEPGAGTTFRVLLPFGSSHLDPASIVSSDSAVSPSTSVIEQYLADVHATVTSSAATPIPILTRPETSRARILVADDNSDLREYVSRILSPHYDVTTVSNGAEAFDLARKERFDLIVSDVMMPEMDGVALLGAVRSEPSLGTTAFILLSARAGEEAAAEGFAHGADDYIAKPFSADELLARVRAHLAAAPLRAHAWQISAERFRAFADQIPTLVWHHDRSGALTFANDAWYEITKLPRDPASFVPETWRQVLHPEDYDTVVSAIEGAVRTRSSYRVEFRMRPADGDDESYRWYIGQGRPHYIGDLFEGWVGYASDVHEGRLREFLERDLREDATARERAFRTLAEAIPVIIWSADATGWVDWYNSRWYEYTGQTYEEATGWGWQAAHHPDDFLRVMEGWPHSIATGEPFEMEFRLRGRDGAFRWFLTRVEPDRDEFGNVVRWYGSNVEIQAQKEALEQSKRIAETLQAVFLPDALPHTSRVRFDATYVAAERDALIGGDWYDAAELPDGRFLISIGDVAGHGLSASVIAGTLRQAITAFALMNRSAAEILQDANRILRFQHPDKFATALVGLIDAECTTLSYAGAGHPPALLAEPGREPRLLPYGDLPLGVRSDVAFKTHEVPIARDAVLALYTDGLTEHSRDMQAAEAVMMDSARALVGDTSNPSPAQTLQHSVLGTARPVDDIAVLVAQFSQVNRETLATDTTQLVKRWRFHSSDANSARSARHELIRFVRRHALDSESVFTAELILGEILANTVEHAPGLVEVTVDWTGEKPVVTTLDMGSGIDRTRMTLPADDLDENGRGLYLIQQLAESVTIAPAKGFGTEVRAVLPVKRA